MWKVAKPKPTKKERLHCCLVCRKKCRHEDYSLNLHVPNSHNAIDGLHSNWVDDSIIASQRPSKRLIEKFDIVKQFQTFSVEAVINLQRPGEHPFCGDGILDGSGFSYEPEVFMQNGIHYYNFPWDDMGVPSVDVMLNITHVIAFIISRGGKVRYSPNHYFPAERLNERGREGKGRKGQGLCCLISFESSRSTLYRTSCSMKKNRLLCIVMQDWEELDLSLPATLCMENGAIHNMQSMKSGYTGAHLKIKFLLRVSMFRV
jgi:hypothetical protein